jgi:ribA/ribD-fused uncharacterized protein
VTEVDPGGERLDPVFFWAPTPPADGRIGPHVLSQWWPARFTVGDRGFATAEHYMMWGKATLFGDHEAAAAVLRDADPRAAKRRGREVRGFDGGEWARHRVDIVVAGNLAKFGQDRDLRDYLLGTGDRVLVEASPEDPIWGIGLAADHPDARVPSRWPGTNLLGFALMRVRSGLAGG